MTTELQVLQNELTIERQKAEILDLKFQLQKTQAEKASRLDDSLFAPALYEHYQKVAETLSKSGVIPKSYAGKPEDIFVAMAMGYQLGFPVEQSLQDIAVINGRPCLWGDGLLSLCLNHPDCQGIDEQQIYQGDKVVGFSCTVKRKGHKDHTQEFTYQHAQQAGLLNKKGVWENYPVRMLQMRARSLALRDKFADALRGLRIAEVEQDDAQIIDAEVVSSNDSQTDKLKQKLMQTGSDAAQQKEDNKKDNSFPSMIETIKKLMKEKNFDEERQKKAFEYFKVKSLSALTDDQARMFISQLEKA
jgi:hypothetical protein